MSTATLAPTGTWNVDPTHSRVGFSIRHLGIATLHGSFTDFEGTIEIADDLASSKASGTVKTASVDTNQSDRDKHLQNEDFFNVEEYPEITFESTSIEAVDDTAWKVTGNLTLLGVTNEIELDAELQGTEADPWGNDRVGLAVTGELSRADYGMKFNIPLNSGNLALSDKVKLFVDISAVKQAA